MSATIATWEVFVSEVAFWWFYKSRASPFHVDGFRGVYVSCERNKEVKILAPLAREITVVRVQWAWRGGRYARNVFCSAVAIQGREATMAWSQGDSPKGRTQLKPLMSTHKLPITKGAPNVPKISFRFLEETNNRGLKVVKDDLNLLSEGHDMGLLSCCWITLSAVDN